MMFNFASVVPGGMVVFVPSYSFLHAVMGAWENSKLLKRLEGKKKVFTEPKETSEVENVLREYTAAVKQASPRFLLQHCSIFLR